MYNNNIWELAEAWIDGRMNAADRQLLEERKHIDPVFAAEFQEAVNMLQSLQGSGEHKRFKTALAQAQKAASLQQEHTIVPKTISLVRNHWRTAAIAASIAIITSLATFSITRHNDKKIASQYSLLRRDLETYKRSQNKLIKDIKEQSTVTPQLEARYTGTGFALTNDGYLVTSYHVIAGADSVYIQNRDGNYYKTHVVAFNEANDVAVLKVEDKKFKFGKQDIPYTIAKSKKKLGARVFTLGFPQDEIVYNEGYISAKNGYNGDSSQYRLDIPAGPGQSGSPVADASGNIIGIITGKESENEATYAVASEAIIDLLNSIPEKNKIRLNSYSRLGKLGREQQIEKMEYYTLAIKVYKK